MATQMPDLHVDHNVTISINTKDWSSDALPMVGFSLHIIGNLGGNLFVVAIAPANSDGQTVSVSMKIPHVDNQGAPPWACELRIAYCTGVQGNGDFGLPNLPQPIATGRILYP